jgi:hypothetical protein
MAHLTLGCDFGAQHLVAIKDLVADQILNNTPHKITGVYGSMRGPANPFRSVRPSRREKSGHRQEFKDSINILKQLGLSVSITLNSTHPHLGGRLRQNIFDSRNVMDELLKYVAEMSEYVDYWIISHPHLVEVLHSHAPSKPKIILSTIMNVYYLSQVEWIRKNWPLVARICPSIYRNRDLAWIARANRIIPLEVLANEFCSIGGIPCEGLYRQACYNSQSLDIRGWNPMKSCCIQSRDLDPASWISARVVLPHWLRAYQTTTGVSQFKISGRTHDAAFVRYIGQVYCSGAGTGSIRKLWGQLEATLNGVKSKKKAHHDAIDAAPDIPMESVACYFNELFKCNLNECRLTCNKCQQIYEEIMEDV